MSQESASTPSKAPPASQAKPAGRSQNAWKRRGVLVGILVLVIGMALYERLHALPASEQAHARLEEEAHARLLSPERPLTAEEVQALIGKPASESRSDEAFYLEKYVWTRGLPWQSYYIWVIYSPNKNYRMHVSNEDPERFMLADVEGEWDDEGPPLDVPMNIPAVAPPEPGAVEASTDGDVSDEDPITSPEE